ncbi:MAG: hypothetical protein V5A50_13960 [Thiohalorhabdus sp.]|uniref:hypothetical protein n=1 Tax=Thiohalorhabdus sp. TaxID=3094134 RepID=UPI002FC33F36
MLGRVISRFIGPKVLLGALFFAGLALGWMWWMYSSASADAAQAEANADEALQAAAANAEAARAARRNAEVIAETLRERQQREQDLRAELSRTQSRLKEARANASEEVRRCLDMPLPDSFLGELRTARGSDPDRDAGAGTASSPD